MARFICKRCNYRFEAETLQAGKKCPYCGEIEIIKEPNAEELLKNG